MRIIAGIIIGLALVVIAGIAIVYSGLINMAATQKPSSLEKKIGETLYESSMDKRAPEKKNPYSATDSEVLASGLDHYRENCVICHGAPGVEASEIGKGLNPPAPMLDTAQVKDLDDGELFWTVQHGIRMTGMPAFGITHSDDEIWKIVAFVRHLPQLTVEEKTELRTSVQEAEHHHGPDERKSQTQTREQTKPHKDSHEDHDHNE